MCRVCFKSADSGLILAITYVIRFDAIWITGHKKLDRLSSQTFMSLEEIHLNNQLIKAYIRDNSIRRITDREGLDVILNLFAIKGPNPGLWVNATGYESV